MSSALLRCGANAHDVIRRSLCSIRCASHRLYAIDAANVKQNQQNDATASSKNDGAVKKLQELFDADVKGGGVVPAFKRSLLYRNKIGIKDENGEYTFSQLFNGSKKLATELSSVCGELKSYFHLAKTNQ